MAGQAIEKALYDAVSKGDLPTFERLLQGDRFLLDGVSFAGSRNLLHIATLYGQAAIVEEVLRILPRLARSLDSQNSTALHIAAAEGNLDITQKLAGIAPEMCWWRDCHGMNPIHIAAVNGHINILKELIERDFFPAMEKVDRGETVLHLCVKHRQLKALEVLVEKLDDAFIETKNDDGQNLLHLAAGYKHVEIIKFLVENTELNANSVDSMGRTTVNMVKGKARSTTTTSHSEIRKLLFKKYHKWPRLEIIRQMHDVTMVVAVLIATMAFQAAVSPPGGVWQEDSSTHKAGEAITASTRPNIYKDFLRVNTIAFASSLIVISLLFIEMKDISYLSLAMVFCLTLMAMLFIAMSYGASITAITPNMETHSIGYIFTIVLSVSAGLVGFFILGVFFTPELVQKLGKWMGQRLTGLNQRAISSTP